MDEVRINMAFEKIKFHVRILCRGFCRTIYGSAIAVMIAMAVFVFFSVSKGTGWIAVFKFSVACVLLIEGLWQMYLMGHNKKGRSGKREGL